MIKDYGNQKLPRFEAGQAFLDQVTAERLNDILAMIEANRLQNGVGYLLSRTPQGTTLNIRAIKGGSSTATKNPFNLYVSSTDEEFCYIAIKQGLVNSTVPIMLSPANYDDDSSIEASPVPTLAVSLSGRTEIYLHIVIEDNGDEFEITECNISTVEAEEDTDSKITHTVILGYIQDGEAVSYHSTSLKAEICEESVTVWAT